MMYNSRFKFVTGKNVPLLFLYQVQLPTYIDNVREKLAENIHELWAMGKIEQNWMYGEVRKYYLFSQT